MTKLMQVRQSRGVSQSELADAAGVSRPFMHDLENGKRNARQDTWERIANVLGCDVDEILHDKNEGEEVKRFHRYYCPQRPPVPGAIPRGVVRIEYAEDGFMIDDEGHSRKAWGFVEYDRELTDKEVADFELDPEVRNG